MFQMLLTISLILLSCAILMNTYRLVIGQSADRISGTRYDRD